MKKLIALLITASMMTIGASAFAEKAESTPAPEPTPVADKIQPTEVPDKIETNDTETAQPTEVPETIETNDTETAQPTAQPERVETNDTEATPEPTHIPQHELSSDFNLNISIIPRKYIIPTDVNIELYSIDDELLGRATRTVSQDTESLDIVFDVPQYRMGDYFKIKLVSGLRMMQYYDTTVEEGGFITVQTYGYINENSEYVQNNGCSIAGEPNYEKELCMYVSGNFLEDISPRARIVDGVSMMPVRAIGEAMGLKVKYDPDYDSVVCSVGNNQVIFNAGSAYTTIFGNDTYAPHATVYIEGSLFVPVRTLAEAFNSSLDVLDFGDHLDVVIGESPMVVEYRNSTPVNKYGISSRTNYLVWVSKHEYKVRVYQGQQYNWELLKEFPCALGAWNTPTITGQFEIIERTQWDYPGYYVGPVLRFYNGYALHSTLLYYGGGEYDGRVGVNISHGCVRLHPQDINWIAATVPFYTRVYITE